MSTDTYADPKAQSRSRADPRGWVLFTAVTMLVWFPAAPLWTLLIVALGVVLIYQLTVNWEE